MRNQTIGIMLISIVFAAINFNNHSSQSIHTPQALGVFGMFKAKRDVFCSEVRGQLLENGKPVANAKLTRLWTKEGGEEETDDAATDENGYFYFPQVDYPKKRRGIFHEFRAIQVIYQINGEEKDKIWANTKYDTELNSENKGAPTVLICELTLPYKSRRHNEDKPDVRCRMADEDITKKILVHIQNKHTQE